MVRSRQVQRAGGLIVQYAFQRRFAGLQRGQQIGRDGQQVATGQRDDLPGVAKARAQDEYKRQINHYAPGVSDDQLVAHLWSTIVGAPIPLDMLAAYSGLIADGSFTQASLLAFAANIDFNTVELIGVIGQTVGLDAAWFPPPGG